MAKKEKNKCQIFTPKKYACFLLDCVGYNKNLYGKRILENSSGKGNILVEIIIRYIEDCLANNFEINKIKKGLEKDIVAYEIDENIADKCLKRINKIAEKYGVQNVEWDFRKEDFLLSRDESQFQYIVGNPPYIKYKDIENKNRKMIKEMFETCKKGKFDYCYPFIEKSLNLLSSIDGKMSYLIPNSVFKNVYANELRNFMKCNIEKIYDYRSKRIFKDALTSSAIALFTKGHYMEDLEYINMECNETIKIEKSKLEDKWFFAHDKCENTEVKFSEYFNASISVATLYNKAYIVNDIKLEKEIIKPAASPKYLSRNKTEYIIFPYYYSNNQLIRYGIDEFKERFPLAVTHLKKFDKQLKNRKADKNARWYEYGRSQALKHLNQEKILISTVVTKKVNVFSLSKDHIPYSGIYIVKKCDKYSLNLAKKILESSEFMEYVKKVGTNASGGALRITVKDINDYNISDFISK